MPAVVRLPSGELLSRADLPKPGQRWVPRRKAIVAQAVMHGVIEYDEALERYDMAPEELDEWMSKTHAGDRRGLQVTQRNVAKS
jgi:hypothetical protein